MSGRDEIEWSKRVPKWKLRRLYESDARGLLDEELLAEVGWMLVERCRDILKVEAAQQGRVHCARCDRHGDTTLIERPHTKGDPRDALLTCPVCGWQITWGEYHLSYKRRQLNPGGAVDVFRNYVHAYSPTDPPKVRMLAIDRLIHEFHFSYQAIPGLPSRPVGVNLIEGKLTDVVDFLNELTFGVQPEIHAEWQRNLELCSQATDRIHEYIRQRKGRNDSN